MSTTVSTETGVTVRSTRSASRVQFYIGIIDDCGSMIAYWAATEGLARIGGQAVSRTVSCLDADTDADEDGDSVFTVDYAALDRAFQAARDKRVQINSDIRKTILFADVMEDEELLCGEEALDVIIQLACFGQIVYG